MTSKATDWDAYYGKVPSYTSLTRNISQQKLISLLGGWISHDRPARICEIGGANSCFVEGLSRKLRISRYHVVDLNARGLELLRDRHPACSLTWERADILAPSGGHETFDVVYSVGLIEHFDVAGTKRAVQGHFARCRPGGIVLMTFPTPTPLYRAIRGAAEAFGIWKFPDERPLSFGEVERDCEPFGRVEHRSVNWMIGLTQGYLAVRYNGTPAPYFLTEAKGSNTVPRQRSES